MPGPPHCVNGQQFSGCERSGSHARRHTGLVRAAKLPIGEQRRHRALANLAANETSLITTAV